MTVGWCGSLVSISAALVSHGERQPPHRLSAHEHQLINIFASNSAMLALQRSAI